MNRPNTLGVVAEKNSITLEQIIDSVRKNPMFKHSGDIITFSGVVRQSSIESNKLVKQIEIQADKDLADKQLTKICIDLISHYRLIDARIVHFQGIFNVSEYLVHCVIASEHRKEGFDALKEMIEKYKHEAYLFKCEIYTDGSEQWISSIENEE